MNEGFDRLYGLAMSDLTENLLPWWMRHGVDPRGGYYGKVLNDNRPDPSYGNFITLSARLVWTFSSAYRVLGDPEYLRHAERAYGAFVGRFYDREHGGWRRRVDAEGNPKENDKYIYGNAFAIYGLSEYHRATGDAEALRLALETAELLDRHVYDPVYGGYFENCDANWRVNPWGRGVNRNPSDEKTMNTHLHLIEAYTALLRARDVPSVRCATRRHLYTMLNKIVNRETHHFHYFQKRDWTPTTPEISFGHDIEGSWLMTETAEVLGEPEAIRAARDVCVNMARACLEEGFREDGAMITEYDPRACEYSERLSWWEQNEAVVGFLNAWELTGDAAFMDAANQCFDFINRAFVDRKDGGWFAILSDDGREVLSDSKLHDGICPYHNGRMSLEIIERWRKHGGGAPD